MPGIYVDVPPVEDLHKRYKKAIDQGVFLLKLSWRSPGHAYVTTIESNVGKLRMIGNTSVPFTEAVFDSADYSELFYGGSVKTLSLYHQAEKADRESYNVKLRPPRWTSSGSSESSSSSSDRRRRRRRLKRKSSK